MKPDFMAPGEDILAAVAREGHFGRDFDLVSGTSMSSPHVAGFGALLKQAHPDWSPAAMRSALATTADPARRELFNVGSGQVNPDEVAGSGPRLRRRVQRLPEVPEGAAALQLLLRDGAGDGDRRQRPERQPSIAIGGLAGAQTVTRR